MLSIPLGIINSLSPMQPQKQKEPMLVSPLGRRTYRREEQSANKDLEYSFTPSGISAHCNEEHPSNAEKRISLSDLGNSMLVSDLQSANAIIPITSTLSGSSISSRLTQEAKAPLSMIRRFAESLTFFSELHPKKA